MSAARAGGRPVEAGAAFALGGALAVLLGLMVYSNWVSRQFEESARWVSRTHEASASIRAPYTELREAQSVMRGYVLTGEEKFLAPYPQRWVVAAQAIAELRQLMVDPDQLRRLDALEPRVAAVREFFDENFRQRRELGFEAARARILTGGGEKRLASVRAVTDELEAAQDVLLATRAAAMTRISRQEHWTDLLLFPVVLLLGGWGVRRFRHEATQRQVAQAQLQQFTVELERSNGDLMDFASIVAHDLKAPVRAIGTLAKWLHTDHAAQLGAAGLEQLDELIQRAKRMDAMIEGILHYSQVGRAAEHPEAVPVRPLLEVVLADLAPPAHVRVTLADPLPTLTGDPAQVRQVFQNLISNAIKHADKPQVEVRVACADRGAEWEFSVADNGLGIEPRHFERIFKMFQTLAPKDKTDSTGIGLALVKRIVERAGGRVWVASRVGEGSTFSCTWPKSPSKP